MASPLRLVLWVLLTLIAIAFVLRNAAKVRRDPGAEPFPIL
jgi:uncharacterized ion transporter superfamily protein YfcC